MANKKNITSRVDGMTKDMVPAEPVLKTFRFPSLGVEVEAVDYREALDKAKALVNN